MCYQSSGGPILVAELRDLSSTSPQKEATLTLQKLHAI